MKKTFLISLLVLMCLPVSAKDLSLDSPDGKIAVKIQTAPQIRIDVRYDGKDALSFTDISLSTSPGGYIGKDSKISKVQRHSVDGKVPSPFYRAKEIEEKYNALTLKVNKDWSLDIRAYNDAVAYRWNYSGKNALLVNDEDVMIEFAPDAVATVPYVKTNTNNIEKQFFNSFENTYTVSSVDSLNPDRLIFLPFSVQAAEGPVIAVTESDLDNYPGWYLKGNSNGKMEGVFAPYPKQLKQGGHNNLQMLVTEREDYIAKIDGPRSLPWRVAVVGDNDLTLARTNISYLLGAPSKVEDISWIRPGKVAWEWWNDWNLEGVDFTTGVNNDTYKAYIDFASRNGIEYVILDEGWAVNKKADLMQVVPEIDIKELVDYGNERGVGIILWAGYQAFNKDMEEICRYYSDLGVKGFKVDFMDRDDQMLTDFNYRAAETAAKHNLILDLHGTSKPAGLNRTFPNVLNFEGVNGLEQVKWAPDTLDMIKYDTQIPFLRQLAGPMDYTQGAMRNASRWNFHASNSEPMSQGTRVHQMALYMIFDSPLTMLCDSPSNYDLFPESRDFIAEVPTVWDETLVLDGKLGEYIVTARRKGDTWWIGAITDWTPRDIEIDLGMLPAGDYNAIIFQDGKNARRIARDYKKTEEKVNKDTKLKLHLAPGGGAALKIWPQ